MHLPEEGSCATERSASSIEQLRAPCAGAVSAQPQCTGLVGGQSACAAGRERRVLIYRSRTCGGTVCRRFNRGLGSSFQPGRPGSRGAATWWSTADLVWSSGVRPDSEGISAHTGSQAGWHSDVVIEHIAAGAAARTGWPAEGQHIHHL